MRGQAASGGQSATFRWPGDPGLVAAPAKTALPGPDHPVVEGFQSRIVQGHCVVVVMPSEDRSQPLPHLRDGLVPSPRKASLTSRSLARSLLRMVCRTSAKRPFRVFPQMWVKRGSRTSRACPVRSAGGSPPRGGRTPIRRVFSGCSSSPKAAKRSRSSFQNRPGFPFVLKARDDVVA